MAGEAINLETLVRWMKANVPGFSGPVTLCKFPGGQSNPTYRIDGAGGPYVLRRKPFGALLPSAHAVDREHRLLAALHPTGFPAPRPIVLCEDPGVIGAMFYVMEMVEGRTFWDGSLPEVAVADRRSYYEAMIKTQALLHSLDYQTLGLGDFGRPGAYVLRQIERWTRQYRAAQTDDLPEVEKLIEWLPRAAPEQTRTSIIHGDYRIDNLIYAPVHGVVRAVLDWELTTIGDPLADFAYLAMNWALPQDGRAGLEGIDFPAQNIPTLDEAVAIYCAASDRDGLPDLHWYFAYNLFRLTGIVQGVKRRMLDGNASSSTAQATAARAIPLAKAAWTQARLAGAT